MEEEKQQRSWMKLHICVFEEHNSLYFFRNIDRVGRMLIFWLGLVFIEKDQSVWRQKEIINWYFEWEQVGSSFFDEAIL